MDVAVRLSSLVTLVGFQIKEPREKIGYGLHGLLSLLQIPSRGIKSIVFKAFIHLFGYL